MTFVRWHSPSQALIAKHVLYPQLTATHVTTVNFIFSGAELAIKGGIIIVTVNYRLNAFGFMSFENEEFPGNYGIADCW